MALSHDAALGKVQEAAEQAKDTAVKENVAKLRNKLTTAVGIYAVLTVARNPDTSKPAGKHLRAQLKEAMGTFEGDIKCPTEIAEVVQSILSQHHDAAPKAKASCSVPKKRPRKPPAAAHAEATD